MGDIRNVHSAQQDRSGADSASRKYELVILGDADTDAIENALLANGSMTEQFGPAGITMKVGQISSSAENTISVELLSFSPDMQNLRNYLCLLPPNALYIVMCRADANDDARELEDRAAHWLEIVRYYADECPVILVWVCSKTRDEVRYPRRTPTDADLKKMNPELRETLEVSVRRDGGSGEENEMNAEKLRRLILNVLDDYNSQDCQVQGTEEGQKLTPGLFAIRVDQLWNKLAPCETPVTHDMIKNQLYYLNRPHDKSKNRQFYKFTPQDEEQARDILRCLRKRWSSISWDVDQELFLTQINSRVKPVLSIPQQSYHIQWSVMNRGGEFPVSLFHRLMSAKKDEIVSTESDCWKDGARFHGKHSTVQVEFHGSTLDIFAWSLANGTQDNENNDRICQEDVQEHLYSFCRIVRKHLERCGIRAKESIVLENRCGGIVFSKKKKNSKKRDLERRKLYKSLGKKYFVQLPTESKARNMTAREILLAYYPARDIIKEDKQIRPQQEESVFRKALFLLAVFMTVILIPPVLYPVCSFFRAVYSPGNQVSPEEVERLAGIVNSSMGLIKTLWMFSVGAMLTLFMFYCLWKGEREIETGETILKRFANVFSIFDK